MAGRLGATPFAGLGYLDGVLGEIRPTASSQVGAFAGTTPDADDASFDGGRKLGAYARLAPRTGPLSYDFTVAGIREDSGGEVSREWVTQEAQVRSGARLAPRAAGARPEPRLARGARGPRVAALGGAGARRLARVATDGVHGVVRAAPQLLERVHARHPRRPLRPAGPRDAARRPRADVGGRRRASRSAAPTGGRKATTARSTRRTAARGCPPRSLSWASRRRSTRRSFTRGLQGSAQATRNLRGGHRLTGAYTIENYDLIGFTGGRLGQRIRASGYGQLPRRSFVRADVEYSLGDDFEGTRAFVEAGVRF